MRFCTVALLVVGIVAGLSIVGTGAVRADTIYVDDDALYDPGPGDPTLSDPDEDGSAAHPFDAIQEAIDAASGGDEVVVLDGTYTGPGNKEIDFAGTAVTVRSQNGPENAMIDCEGSGRGFHFHSGETSASVVDGFTIRNGFSTGFGGGMYNCGSDPTVANCSFIGNSAFEGGGIHDSDSSPMVTNCTFYANSAQYGFGGGMSNECGSNPTVTNCTFIGNSSYQGEGGGMYNSGSSPTLTNCTFSGNSAANGGGMRNSGSSLAVTNCTFSNNSADWYGGGMNSELAGDLTLTNCIFWGNEDCSGTGESAQICGQPPDINYSCVQEWSGDLGGEGNIGDDPLFVDANGEDDITGTEDDDLHLQAGSPCIDAADNTAVPPDEADLDEDEDTAEQTPLDLDHHPRFVDDPETETTGVGSPEHAEPEITDMGAYELQVAGDCNDNGVPDDEDIAGGFSLDCNGNNIPDECEYPDCPGILPADMNCDEQVDGADIPAFTDYCVAGRYTCQVDMIADQTIDEADVAGFVNALLDRLPGDLNCDGSVDPGDIEAFVLALIDPAAYADAHAACDISLADMNKDGSRDGRDIRPFVDELLQPS